MDPAKHNGGHYCVSLPFELLANIARYLGPGDLRKWMHIHPAFQEAVLDRRYRELCFSPTSHIELSQQLETIESNPAVTSRIRAIKLEPDKIWDSLHLKKAPISYRRIYTAFSSSGPVHVSTAMYREKKEPTQNLSGRLVTSDSIRDSLVALAKILVNVEDLDVRWERQMFGRKYQPYCPLLSTFFPAFGSNLRSLSMVIPQGDAKIFIPTPVTALSRLEKLELYMNGVPALSELDTFLPLINGVSRTLQSLRIASPAIGHASSPFFRGLGRFPCLTNLSLRNPTNDHGLPYGVLLLLDECDHSQRIISVDTEEQVSNWLRPTWQGQWRHFRAITVKGLRDIDLFMNSHEGGGIDLSVANGLRRTITSLDVSRPHLDLSEVKGLTSLFSSVTHLTFTIKNLTPQLIDLLVTGCQGLTHLCLEIRRHTSSELGEELYNEVSRARPQTNLKI
ncbi:hypothetical protein DXG01_012251 [Tephrocybe rancida]|nr:hypothetical protein DXG01_012251 [Tephrocybe rancida]